MTIDKLAWIHIADRKLLATRTRGREAYYLPGGKREPAETDQQALVREIKEELSVDLVQAQIAFAGTFEAPAHGAAPGVMVRMTCYEAPFMGVLTPCREIEEIAWLRHRDCPRSSEATQLILNWLRSRDRIDE